MSGFEKGNQALIRLLNHYRLNMVYLTQKAGIALEDGYKILKGETVKKETAQKLLAEINKRAGIRYSLEDVGIKVEKEGY